MHHLEHKWLEFMTERDKEHHRVWGKKALAGFGSKPALLLVDIYYSVLGLKREPIFESMKLWPGSMGMEGWEAVDKTARLLSAARASGIPVIHVKGLHSGVNKWIRRGKTDADKPNPEMTPELIRKGTEIVDEVKPIPGELVIEKAAPSAFHGTPLLFQLISLGVDTLLVCGESTSGCVRATAVDGATHRFKVGVVSDCVFDRTESSHYINLYDLHQKYADVVDSGEAEAYMRSAASGIADAAAARA
ncbi:isochorismatase family protein [Paenibacillus sp.]|uniref:isochorismatase family protein n=1 Tax=Paenibacillus sp. TaxID=58172 RepID=UPI002D28E0AB|nr:isochorismatase family protein [Paenibacillus sp.]HZG55139.1 isochorismatase family protein [Paenibacillus sp.]